MTLKTPQVKINPLFPKGLKKKEDYQISKVPFYIQFSAHQCSLVEAITKMLGYATFMKELVTKKKTL